MPVLVTGATGLVGNNVARMLLSRGEAVRVLTRESSDERPLADLDVEVRTGDLRDPQSVARALLGVDRVIHAAAIVQVGWTGMSQQQSINVDGTRTVAGAARRAGARMVYVSSIDALGFGTAEHPVTETTPAETPVACPYVVTKQQAEEVVLEQVRQGLDAVIVNPSFMLGPWDWKPSSGRMLLEVARGRTVFAPPGGNNFVHVEDVAAGILSAMQRGRTGQRYVLGGQDALYRDAWRIFAEVVGARPPIAVVGPHLLRVAGRAGDLWGRIAQHEPDLNSASASMAVLQRHLDSARAVEELGYSARPYRQAAEDAWQWFCQFGYAPRKRKAAATEKALHCSGS